MISVEPSVTAYEFVGSLLPLITLFITRGKTLKIKVRRVFHNNKYCILYRLHNGRNHKVISFFKKRFYLFIHERHRERDRDIGRGRSRLLTSSPMQDSIPGPQDHDLSQMQTFNL